MSSELNEIVKRDYYVAESTPHGGGSVIVTLSCGHEQRYKASRAPKRRARCRHCLNYSRVPDFLGTEEAHGS